VTQAEYLAVVGSNPSYFNTNNGFAEDLSRPVEQVTWFDATNYAALLTQRERVAGRIVANCAYRLPTEAEWEYACRGLTSTRFSHGDDLGYTSLTNYAWYHFSDATETTHSVGRKLPNPWGVHDMHGNVQEWCLDWWGAYSGGTQIDPQGPALGLYRVLRGGSSWDPGRYCRSAYRNGLYVPTTWANIFGFRVILAPCPP